MLDPKKLKLKQKDIFDRVLVSSLVARARILCVFVVRVGGTRSRHLYSSVSVKAQHFNVTEKLEYSSNRVVGLVEVAVLVVVVVDGNSS